ncbi:MAG: hypothetical protein Q9181_002162 [Wetmoreana brouardii]
MWPSRKRVEPSDRTASLSSQTSAAEQYVQRDAPYPRTNLSNGSFSLSSRPAFGRKATGDVLKGLPALPLPNSEVETVSSVYSQPSPEMQSSYMPERLHIPQKHDVSPPESLRRHGNQNNSRRSSPDISPVTENSSPIVERPPVNGKHTSGIPVLKKTQAFGGAGKMWSNWRGKGAEGRQPDEGTTTPTGTRWDDYSGERTTSEKGKPGQVTPGSIPFDAKPGPVARNPAFGMTTTISSGNAPVRRKKVPSREENFMPAVREEWKGASGRHKIINPLMDKPLPPGKSAVFPTGSRRLSESPDEPIRSRDAISPTNGLALAPISGESTPTRDNFRPPAAKVENSGQQDLPDRANISPPVSIITAPDHQFAPDPNHIPIADRRSPLARHPSTEALRLIPQPPTPEPTPNNSRDYGLDHDFRANFGHLNLKEQPQSRFSATTYATTAYDSPPATPEATHESPVATPPSSILNRKRPIPPAGLPSKRRPTPSEAELARERRHSKTLPKSPPEMEAQDRVASLQASLDGLRRRRNNIQTALHELTKVVQPSSIAYDMAARNEVKRTVEGLNKDLAEIMKEEHETGLKLHRAWKRQDKSSAYEPTTLWVRRVTT